MTVGAVLRLRRTVQRVVPAPAGPQEAAGQLFVDRTGAGVEDADDHPAPVDPGGPEAVGTDRRRRPGGAVTGRLRAAGRPDRASGDGLQLDRRHRGVTGKGEQAFRRALDQHPVDDREPTPGADGSTPLELLESRPQPVLGSLRDVGEGGDHAPPALVFGGTAAGQADTQRDQIDPGGEVDQRAH